jgi:nucleotide-binding universal stress UspA family protein
MRILIGYNGTPFSDAAIEDLPAAGLPDKAEALVVTVAELCFATVCWDDATRLADVAVDRIRKAFPEWKFKTLVASGPPAGEILDQANVFNADLIVLGERSGGNDNMFLGPVSQKILTESDCSVRIARPSRGNGARGRRLLIGFDGSAGSIHTVSSVARREWPAETSVRLLSVADSSVLGSIGRFVPQMGDAVVEERLASQWAQTLAHDSLDILLDAGLSASLELRMGHPKNMIVETANEWNADCIFVGPHCAGNSYERFLLGSVSAAVAARAHCSVEVVRHKGPAEWK